MPCLTRPPRLSARGARLQARAKHSPRSRRLRQFSRHVYGRPLRHRGGQGILLLDSPKTIAWAAVEDYAEAEHRLISTFLHEVGPADRRHDSEIRLNAAL